MKQRLKMPWTFFLLALVSLALVPFPVSGAPADPPYTVTRIDALESSGTANPVAINAAGDVVGLASVLCGPFGLTCTRAFVYDHATGVTTQLGVLGDGAYYSVALGINAAGDVVGSSAEQPLDGSYPGRAVLYPGGGGPEFLPPLGAPSVAQGINDAGLIVGAAFFATPYWTSKAFLYDPRGLILTDIHAEITGATHSRATAINAGGDVVGSFDRLGQPRQAFFRHANGPLQVLSLPAGLSTDVDTMGVNASGQVIGTTNYSTGNEPISAILWSGGTARDLGTLPPLDPLHPVPKATVALGINGSGQVVGGSNVAPVCPADVFCAWKTHAFLYSSGVMQDLNELIPSDSGWELLSATAINDAGQITALGQDRSGQSSVALLLTPSAPSPTSMIESLVRLVEGFNLPKGTQNSFLTKLQHAQTALAAGDTSSACDALGAFLNETRAQAGKKLTADQAAQMTSGAQQIRAAIGCS